MKAVQTTFFSALSIALGIGAAFLARPLFHEHGELGQTQWAYEYQNLDQMVTDVDAIVIGTVVRTTPSRVLAVSGGNALLPFTYVDVQVEETIKGPAPALVTFEQTGGRINEQESWLEGEGGPYAPGSRVLLFLKEQGDTGVYIVAHPKGRFEIAGDVLIAARPDDKVAAALQGLHTDEAASYLRAFLDR